MTKKDLSKTAILKVDEAEDALKSSRSIISKPCLILMAGYSDLIGKQWIIDNNQVFVGRIEPADVLIPDASISKSHAKIEFNDEVATITDLGSTNKTLINGSELIPNTPKEIKNNDHITLGKIIFRFLKQGLTSETRDKERMQKELSFAGEVQNTMFPSHDEFHFQSTKVVGRYRSASECCGDWWWYWVQNDKLYVILADATGHGASAALATSVAHTCISNLEDKSQISIAEIYTTLNSSLYKSTGGKIKMSAIVLEVNLEQTKVSIVNASHPNPVVFEEHKTLSSWRDIDYLNSPISPALGSYEAFPQVESFDILPGSHLLMYTDGLQERAYDNGQPASDRFFNQLLIEAHGGKVEESKDFLMKILEISDSKANNQPQGDDITLVVLAF